MLDPFLEPPAGAGERVALFGSEAAFARAADLFENRVDGLLEFLVELRLRTAFHRRPARPADMDESRCRYSASAARSMTAAATRPTPSR